MKLQTTFEVFDLKMVFMATSSPLRNLLLTSFYSPSNGNEK